MKRGTRSKSQLVLSSPSPLLQPRSTASSPATLTEKVYRAFKHDIIHGIYQPGEALSEKELVDRYSGSRTPVREAVVRLQNERLVRIVPNRGYFVSQITLQVLNDIYEFRTAVECASAELAALRGGEPEYLKKLSQWSKVTCTAEDRQSCMNFIEADSAFHIGIARLTRNQMLLQAVSEARSQMEHILFAAIDVNYYGINFYGEVPGREHHEILRAIQDRDPERARRRMHDHIMQSKGKVLGVTSAFPLSV